MKTVLAWLLLLSSLPLAVSCNYYRVRKEEPVTDAKLSALPNYKRFLVHQGSNTWELRDVTVKEQRLEGNLIPVPAELLKFVNPKTGSPNRYKRDYKALALNIVHLHVFEIEQGAGNSVAIPMSAIKRLDITDMDTGATVASHVLATVGVLAAAWALVAIIVILTKSSCPYVYVYNGENFEFVGESYGGAIFSPLERHDYMPLPRLRAGQEGFQVKIANELKERQFTNLAELLVVQHPEGVRVLLDQEGKPHTLAQVQLPLTALASDGLDYATQLSTTDSSAYLFNHEAANINKLTLKYLKPATAKKAKLVLHARNSLWLDYMYGEFIEQFGASYTTWAEKQKKVPAAEHLQWQQEQAIPLLVEVETAQGWTTVAQVPTVGPLAGRDLVIPFDLSGIKGDKVNVRLSSGFMFWEVDHLLAADDNEYLKQFMVGEEVLLTFPVPENMPGSTHSSFLHTKGYYEHIREFEGTPDILSLMSFKRPGWFTQFSKERYHLIINSAQLKPLQHVQAIAP